jgi:Na+-transporting NADH:ubiquinone oxidoreductase subunit A
MRFPFDDPALLARCLRLPSGSDVTVWALSVEGVLAVDAALSGGMPCVDRVVSVAGPAIDGPAHVRAVVGQPIEQVLEGRVRGECVRIVNGGLLTGEALPPEQRGLDGECTGLTALGEPDTQALISFAMPGVSRRSYSRTFVGTLRTDMSVPYKAGLSGEVRPCVSCGLCADVCPAGILPALIHKQLYAGKYEEAQRLRVDLCVGCGLCSFVCPSKIDLRSELLRAVAVLREEAALVRAEAEAAAAEAAAETEEAAAGAEGADVTESSMGEDAK